MVMEWFSNGLCPQMAKSQDTQEAGYLNLIPAEAKNNSHALKNIRKGYDTHTFRRPGRAKAGESLWRPQSREALMACHVVETTGC